MIDNNAKKQSALIHLSSLLGFAFPFGNVIAPAVVWIMKKEEHDFINQNGKAVVNAQISYTIYLLLLIGGFFFEFFSFNTFSRFEFFFVFTISFYIINIILAAIGASRAYHGKTFYYPLAILFL